MCMQELDSDNHQPVVEQNEYPTEKVGRFNELSLNHLEDTLAIFLADKSSCAGSHRFSGRNGGFDCWSCSGAWAT